MKPMMNNPKAFTLTEVLVSMLVVVIIGAASWRAVSVLSPSSEVTLNRIKAENLITKSQEEVRRVSQNLFDRLETCDFTETNTCGFVDTTVQFPEFVRTLVVTREGTAEFKRVNITVSWNEFGTTKILDSVMLLSRPPEPLPGNLIGMVRDRTTNAILGNVQIMLRDAGSSDSSTTVSAGATLPRPDGKEINYDFAEQGTGRFLVKAGTWRLTASRAGYIDFTLPQDIIIASNEEQQIDFTMESQPTSAHISGRLVHALNGSQLNFSNYSVIHLYEAGTPVNQKVGGGSFNFEVTFSDSNQRCFTLATMNAYKSAFAGNFACTYHFQAAGWSSSVVGVSGINCSNPWVGNASSDRICVNPGDNLITDIPLVGVPTATINGYVLNSNGAPIAGADILVRWHDNTSWPSQPIGQTNASGYYEVIVPSEQDMFANSTSNYVRLRAQINVPITRCCSEPGSELRQSVILQVGPLYQGNIVSRNMVINTNPGVLTCGNAQGNIIDDKVQTNVPGAGVVISSLTRTTDGGGAYVFQCNEPSLGYRLPAGAAQLTAAHNSYYSYSTAGNSWYTASGPITIVGAQNTVVPEIGLWPRGLGNITGTVRNAGNNLPLYGIPVVLNLGIGGTRSAVTNNSGVYSFNNVSETWPPSEVLGNIRYQQTVHNHFLSVAVSDNYESYTGNQFTLNAGENRTEDIILIPRGGL